jgi:hypothetical protein
MVALIDDGGVDRHEVALLGDHAWVVHVAHRPQLACRVLVHELVQACRAEGEGRNGLGPVDHLGDTGDDALLDEVDHAVAQDSVWTPRSRCPDSAARMALGVAPMPVWIVAPSGMRSAT